MAASLTQPNAEAESLKSLVQNLEEKNKLLSQQYEKTVSMDDNNFKKVSNILEILYLENWVHSRSIDH